MPESVESQNLSPNAGYRLRNAGSDAGSVCASGSICSNLVAGEEEIPVDEIRSTLRRDEDGDVRESAMSLSTHENRPLPQVTITPSRAQLPEAADPDASIDLSYLQCVPNSVPFPLKNNTEPQSTSSSIPSDRDKLAELPASNTFIGQRVFSASRKTNADNSSLHTHESFASLNPLKFRAPESENSLQANKSRERLPKRISFDNDRLSISSSIHNVKNAITRAEETFANASARAKHTPRARSPSPLHFLFPKTHHRYEPFLPIDPYKFNICKAANFGSFGDLFSQILRQSYRHLLLRLPSIYFSRVTRVFTAAELSRPEVERMIEGRNQDKFRWPADHEWVDPIVSPAMIRFKESWECFIESVLKEWKTLNVVSALLLTAVLAILQIEGASRSLIIRSTASLSLICGLMSLIYGCVYILRFATMKSMYKAFIWAEETQQVTSIIWNIWVLLSMPAVWIAWSMLFFCISILAFVWEEPGSISDDMDSASTLIHKPRKSHFSSTRAADITPKVLISLVFALGLFYFVLVIRTFRSWRDTDISQATRNSMEIGRWMTKSPSPGREVANALKQGKEGNINATLERQTHQAECSEGKVNQIAKGVEQKKSRRTRSVGSTDVFQVQ